jgi:hypothetical protein
LCGVHKPAWQLWIGILLLFGGIYLGNNPFVFGPNANLVAFGAGAVLLYFYFITKNLTLTFSTGDMGDTRGLEFTATKVDGHEITEKDLLLAIENINRHIIAAQKRSSV